MAAFAPRVGPTQGSTDEIEITEGRTVVGKWKEGGANVVEKARKGELLRVNRPARARLRFQHQHLPAVPGERRRRHEAIGASAYDDRVVHLRVIWTWRSRG